MITKDKYDLSQFINVRTTDAVLVDIAIKFEKKKRTDDYASTTFKDEWCFF